jgi:hypothetical protein
MRFSLTLVVAASLLSALPALAQDANHGPFDVPTKVDVIKLPVEQGAEDSAPAITCSRYADFMVKEVDKGELGADKLALLPKDAPCEETTVGEIIIKDDMVGYYMEAKGSYVFFTGSDGYNGGMPFVVIDAKTQKHLFDDSFALDEDVKTATVEGTKLTMTFKRVYTADCSLYEDKDGCSDKVKAATGLGKEVAMPDCKPIYDAYIKENPDYASDAKTNPSVMIYEAALVFDGTKAAVTPVAANMASCVMAD